MSKKEDTEKSKDHSAREIAEIMVQNMIANMNNPNYIEEKELRMQEAAKKVLDERRKREEAEENEEE